MHTGKERLPRELSFPLLVKPVAEGTSKGVTKKSIVRDEGELREVARELIAKYRQPALVEAYVAGREFTVGLLGERRPRVLPLMEIVFLDASDPTPIYSFDMKQDWNDKIRYEVPARLSPRSSTGSKAARECFTALGAATSPGSTSAWTRRAGSTSSSATRCRDSRQAGRTSSSSPRPPASSTGASSARSSRSRSVATRSASGSGSGPGARRRRRSERRSRAPRWSGRRRPRRSPAAPTGAERPGEAFRDLRRGRAARIITAMSDDGATNEPRRRARERGSARPVQAGRWNAITDVAGVKVGHSTDHPRGGGPLKVGKGPVRTGVTAILTNAGNVFEERVVGGGFILNGAGEVSGMTQLLEWGLIETPIFLTNTLSVGAVSDAAVKWMIERHPGIGHEHDVIIPLVGECDDSWLNDIAGRHVHEEHVTEALRTASDGPVPEGSVGGGTGMITCDFKAGIGTASRKLPEVLGGYTVGVLVMSNFGVMRQLRVGGLPVGEVLDARYRSGSHRTRNYGSIIAVIATDAPLITHQLNRLAKRAALGIGRVGSTAMHGSGEIILAFSTANKVPRESRKMVYRVKILLDQRLDPLYEAVIEATEEAILNACAWRATSTARAARGPRAAARGREGARPAPALPRGPRARLPGPQARRRARARPRIPVSAAKPTAVRGAEGMPRPARPATPVAATRIERADARSDSQESEGRQLSSRGGCRSPGRS